MGTGIDLSAMLVRPVGTGHSFQQTHVLSFFAGFTNVHDALNSKIPTLDSNFLQVAADLVVKQRKFTIVKPTDDVTFMLVRAAVGGTVLKLALLFGTVNVAYSQKIQTEDAKIYDIKENQPHKNSKVDIVQFEFKSAIVTEELSLPTSAKP